jgi:Fe-S oxidoreductase
MFSEIAKKNADACRFCFMCRHLCPVQLATGKESNTPRAKGLLVSMFNRGMTMDKSSAQIMYECLLCGACTDDCATGFEPPVFIREARTQAIIDGIAPEYATKLLDTLLKTGDIYGTVATSVKLDGIPHTGEVLAWLGETARYSTTDVADAFLSVLKKAGVSFAVLKDEPSSGCTMGDLMGYVDDVRRQAEKAAKAIQASGAKKLVVLDSYDAAFFLHQYKDWGIDLPEIVTASAFADELIKAGKLKPRKEALVVTYHDGSRLARDLEEYQPARDILTAMGCEIDEMFQNRNLARACGSALFTRCNPGIAKKIAQGRWENAMRTKAKVLVAACPQSTEALGAVVPEGYQYKDLFILLNERCRNITSTV